MSSRFQKWLFISAQLESVQSAAALKSLHQRMLDIAVTWRNQGASAAEILQLINVWHDAVVRRTIKLALKQLRLGGAGSPPSAFSWVALGSGGRGEQSLFPDQDHAIIYEDLKHGVESNTPAYFQQLASAVTDLLLTVGYPLCIGYVMAANERWNQSQTGWQKKMQSYIEYPDWDNVRFLALSADARHVYGVKDVFTQAHNPFFAKIKEASFIHWQIADRFTLTKTALDMWGKFRTHQSGEQAGHINIKEGGYLQIVNAVRLWAIANGIRETSTLQRVNRLQDMLIWDEALANRIRESFSELQHHRLWGNYVNVGNLTQEAENKLKDALITAKKLQKITAGHFQKPK